MMKNFLQMIFFAICCRRSNAFSRIVKNRIDFGSSRAASIISASAFLGPTHTSASKKGFFFSKSSSTLKLSKKEEDPSFKTWTFDDACDTMEMNDVSNVDFNISDDVSTSFFDDFDLIILGISGPSEENNQHKSEEEDDDDDSLIPKPNLTGKAMELDLMYGGALTETMIHNYKEFKHGAKTNTFAPLLSLVSEGGKIQRILLVGLGSQDDETSSVGFFTKLGSNLASKFDSINSIKKVSVVLPQSLNLDEQSLCDLSTGVYSNLYSDNRFRTGDNVKKISEELEVISILIDGQLKDGEVGMMSSSSAFEKGKAIARGVILAKDIVNAPHNVLNSRSLANVAKQICGQSNGTLTCKVLDKEECESRGMGAYLGVARGSETEPQFIHLTYTPKNGNVTKKIGIIGKGLLFDTGGYNIKTAMMELMKFDCGGAAAVLGAARAIGYIAPEGVEAHFVVAACENMINERAVVPSDVLTASNGKTIEIINTDAEGRLTLADALVYADKEIECEEIIELSTLTGACMVSLGKKVCGLWTSNDKLAGELAEVSNLTGEKSWRMPLEKEYNEQLKSKIADISNCGTRYGGAITAALFLQNFVDKDKPFAHIDIAGPVWCDKTGATGFGAKLVTEWISRQAKSP